MFERFETNSIRFRMSVAVILIAALLLCILAASFAYSASMIRSQVYTTYQSILATFSHGLESNLVDVESFLIGCITDNADLQILDEHGPWWSLAASRQQQDLSDAILTYSMADGLFVFEPDYNIWVDATVSNYSNAHRRQIRSFLFENIEDPTVYQSLKKWGAVQIGEEFVFFRILRSQGCYIGAWVRAGTITNDFILDENAHSGALLLGGETGIYDPDFSGLALDLQSASKSYRMTSGYMAVSEYCQKLDAYLVLLIKDDSVTRELDRYLAVIAILCLCALAAVGVMFFASYQYLMKPLHRLTGAMKAFQQGNWDIRLPEETELDEYADINATFNHMVEQVEGLKIDVYEQKAERLHIENQLLKQQMAPHTLINCLNTIHGLAGSGKTALVQKMAEDLGIHLRYLLSGSQMVSFRQELNHTRNYVEICNIRYANGIFLEEQLEDQVLNAFIPPLLIYGFVENSVKYALSPPKPTRIGLKAWREGESLHLRMWDNGPGYDSAMLCRLSDSRNVNSCSGSRIGLVNLCRRSQLLYGDGADIRFSNRPEGGAQMDVSIPYKTSEGWTK